jgi:ectoine hydroxylase-related dioxygenase (phytanoyl-CoA dioxygenase family)
MMLTEEQILRFKRDGYLLAENVLSAVSLTEMFESVEKAFHEYGGDSGNADFSGFADVSFNRNLIDLRQRAPSRFSAVYDAMLASYALQKLCFNNRLGEYSAELLGVPPSSLCYRGTMLRMDTPMDTRNVYGWHQDSSYTHYNSDGLEAIVAWCPLVDVNEHNGALQVCRGSHLEPTVQPMNINKGKGYSVQNIVDSAIVEKYPVVDVNASARDVVFSYSSLVHRSGQNSSENVRFTAIVRYHNMFSKDFHLFPKD